MGHTHHDPIDHFRTTDQHAGEWMIDALHWPGLSLVAIGVSALIAADATLAYQHLEWLLTVGLIAVSAIATGVAWNVHEHRRVRRLETRWLAEHPNLKSAWRMA